MIYLALVLGFVALLVAVRALWKATEIKESLKPPNEVKPQGGPYQPGKVPSKGPG